MIQALRDLVDLYTFYYEILERSLDGLLDLLCVCICQGWSTTSMCICILMTVTENDTLARIGTSCLQQFLENNARKLNTTRWERVASTFVKLFRTTTPHQLFDETLRVEIDGSSVDFDTSGKWRSCRCLMCTNNQEKLTLLDKQFCLLLSLPLIPMNARRLK